MTQNGDLSNERKRWSAATYAKAKERGGERTGTDFRTSSAEVQPLYTPEDVADIDYNRDIGYPGEYPYTRGVQASICLLYTSPSPRDRQKSRMPSSA